MDVKVELEEFSEGGDWPPSDDSWFWDSRKVEVVDGDTDNIDAPTQSQIDVSDAEERGALGGEIDLQRKRQVEWKNRRPRFGMCPVHWRRRRHGIRKGVFGILGLAPKSRSARLSLLLQ